MNFHFSSPMKNTRYKFQSYSKPEKKPMLKNGFQHVLKRTHRQLLTTGCFSTHDLLLPPDIKGSKYSISFSPKYLLCKKII